MRFGNILPSRSRIQALAPRKIDERLFIEALLYLARSIIGCATTALPADAVRVSGGQNQEGGTITPTAKFAKACMGSAPLESFSRWGCRLVLFRNSATPESQRAFRPPDGDLKAPPLAIVPLRSRFTKRRGYAKDPGKDATGMKGMLTSLL